MALDPGRPDICLWKKMFGWCPFTGTTHALNAFFHGDVKSAVRYNLNVVALVPVIFWILAADILKIARRFGKGVPSRTSAPHVLSDVVSFPGLLRAERNDLDIL